ncbi:hypothetical protein ABTZ99_40065 [Actinosynnema sp. NPDC002837]
MTTIGKLVALACAALALTTACGGGDGSSSAAGDTGEPKTIASADEVIKVVDKGFVTYKVEKPGVESDYLSYGYVIENVSDEVALTVRVAVEFTDEAGKPLPDVPSSGNEFSVVLPGRRMGAGHSESYAGPAPGGDRPTIAGMNVKITLITALDTPDGERYRKPPAPYAELATGDPVVVGSNGRNETVAAEVTNTYDVPPRPKLTAVVRNADGVIVGGMNSEPVTQQIQPGDSARAEFFDRDIRSPKVAEGTVECYADPNLGRMITRTPVWQDT